MTPAPVTPDTPLRPDRRLAYRLGDAAERLGVHRITVWRWVRDGKLPNFKIGSLMMKRTNGVQERHYKPAVSHWQDAGFSAGLCWRPNGCPKR